MPRTFVFQTTLPSVLDKDEDAAAVEEGSRSNNNMENMEIAGGNSDSDDSNGNNSPPPPPSKAKAMSNWIRNKFQTSLHDVSNNTNSAGQKSSYVPLRSTTTTARRPRRFDYNYTYDSHNIDEDATRQVKQKLAQSMTDPIGRSSSGSGDDKEEASSSSSTESSSPARPKQRRSSSFQNLSGIEVEIESSTDRDDCLYRKRYLDTIWFLHKKQIILAVAFLFVWLLGILIGACGSGQCRSSSSSQIAAIQSVGTSCSGTGLDDSSSQGSTVLGNNNSNDNNVPQYDEAPTLTNKPPSKPSNNEDELVATPIITNPKPTFLGPNVMLFDPSMSTAEIQRRADQVFRQQQNNEMGRERYALLFQPGVYGSATEPLMIQIGYYTEVAGLGQSPQDVRIMGKIEVYNRCFEKDPYQDGKFIPTDNSEEGLCFALNSFWRGLSNLSIQIITPGYQDTCRATAMFWAISQAASMRRVSIEGGDVSLMDYCSNPAYASGGFIADSKIGGKIISGSQQQFLTRNSNVGEWSGSAWNQVLLGVTGAPADDSKYPDPAITTIESNPANRERPWLYVDDAGAYNVFVPAFTSDTKDTSWSLNGGTPGKSIPISDFYVAKPGDAVSEINEQLSAGKHLLLTPGVYDADESILVERADTVVLGLGIATLTAVNGAVPLKVSSQPGIIVAGVTFDGGLTLSPVLLQVGALGDPLTSNGDPNNPITLSDVYFRIGGPHIGKSNVCLEINSNHVLVDHTWVWRADHGVEDFDKSDGFDGDNERWATNTGLNGVIVNGNDVTATGLFVEHFQEYNLCWNGERGRVFFFQNELPYEPPSQAEWTADDGTLGWAAYKVSDAVTEHELWCGGVYCYNRNNPDVVTVNAFEVPERDGVVLNRIYTRNLSGPGTIQHIVNGVGRSVTDAEKGPFYVIQYP